MICKYCGNTIDSNAVTCPYCGSKLADYDAADDYDNYGQNGGYAQDDGYTDDDGYAQDEGYDDEEAQAYVSPKKKSHGLKVPNIPLSTIISIASAIFSFICLLTVSSMKASLRDSSDRMISGLGQIQTSAVALEDRISSMEAAVASAQSDAYNQLASQNISITKDITSLTGPVSMGKYNQMFIVKAKGNLDMNTSFDWQKYNEATNGWVSIVFTGKATSNDEYGLRIENKVEAGEYISVLWANGITSSGAGTYRCVITDTSGIKKTSSEAIVQVSD
ncbi:MAG: zinc-ribbon domain-containing protein [Candidatus Limivicinus sp.]|jgi:hypothetical protein